MRYKISYIILLLFLLGCKEQQEKKSLQHFDYTAFSNITIIDGKGNPPQKNMVLILKDNLIFDIAKNKDYKFPTKTRIINSQGKYAIPGLIDIHAHVTVLPIDSNKRLINKYEKEASLSSLKTMLSFGITTIRNPAAPTSDGIEIRELVKNNDSIISPDIYTAGYALNRTKAYFGPFVATPTEEDVRNEVKKQIEAGVDFIKVYASLKPNLIKAAIDEAHTYNVKVIGHLQNTTWSEAAILGIDYICHAAPWNGNYLPEHLQKNYRPTFIGRLFWLENVDYASNEFAEMFKALRENNVSIDPTLITFHTKFWGDDAIYTENPDLKLAHPTILNVWETATFTDSWTENDYIRAKIQWQKLLQLTKLLYDNGIMLTAGSDFPNPWVLPGKSLHQEMKLLNDAGISTIEVIKIATYNGAKSLGIENLKGSLEKGKIADIVILNASPVNNIQNTLKIGLIIKSGKIYSQNE